MFDDHVRDVDVVIDPVVRHHHRPFSGPVLRSGAGSWSTRGRADQAKGGRYYGRQRVLRVLSSLTRPLRELSILVDSGQLRLGPVESLRTERPRPRPFGAQRGTGLRAR